MNTVPINGHVVVHLEDTDARTPGGLVVPEVARGTGYTLFPGRIAEDLRQSLKERTSRAGGTQVDLGKIGYNQLAQQQWRSLVVAPIRTLRRMVQRMMP